VKYPEVTRMYPDNVVAKWEGNVACLSVVESTVVSSDTLFLKSDSPISPSLCLISDEQNKAILR
jgi:hypothetical protein